MRSVSIFGATGSIGQSTIDLIARAPDSYRVVALTGGANIETLARDAIRLKAQVAVTADDSRLDALRAALGNSGVDAQAGRTAILDAADRPVDWTMSAIIGVAGLEPGLRALRHGGTLALANKESLVTAGRLLMETAQRHGATVLPVDSEHSAIFQALSGERISDVTKITITASGGAFRDWPLADLATATVDAASTHPNWDMGQRITIDSASMFNKALELIETREYFGVDPDMIDVLVHRQSLVHALVSFRDGAQMAHLGPADMRHAIGYALYWPGRGDVPVPELDLAEIGQLDFARPDPARYPALDLARRVMNEGGMAGAVFNGAKEAALDAFIAGRIGFTRIADVVAGVLDAVLPDQGRIHDTMTLDNVHALDHLARQSAAAHIQAVDR